MNIFQKFISKIARITLPKDVKLSTMKAHIHYTKISFDASIMPNGDLGIGMHDITNKVRLCEGGKLARHSALKGEQAALRFTLKYAHEAGIKNLVLFTDNVDLARRGITKDYITKYSFEEIHLTWVPRELNQEADKQSKNGQKLNKKVDFAGPSANETIIKEVKEPKKTKKAHTKAIPLSEGPVGFHIFAKYSYAQKVKMLENLSNPEQHHEQEFIRMLKQGDKDDYVWQISNHNIAFVRMAKTILYQDPECTEYVRKRFKGMKDPRNRQGLDTLSYDKFEAEFDTRNRDYSRRLKRIHPDNREAA